MGSYLNRHGDHYNEIVQLGKETGLDSEYCMGMWEFIAKEQVGVSGWKTLREKRQG